MKIKFIILIVFLFVPALLHSQAILNENLYFVNKYPINPAYAGSFNFLQTYINYRKTSAVIEGSPTLINFGANATVYKNMGLGTRIYKQSEGLFDIITGFADYSYHLKINNEHSLRFGISAGFGSNQLDYSGIIADDPSAIIDVASKNFVGIAFQSAAGIVYNWNDFEWSISSPQLFESKNTLSPSFSSFMQYQIDFKNQNLCLKPSLFIKYKSNSPTLIDVTMQAYWKDLFWLGLGYRNRPGFIASTGFKLKQVNLAYAIEIASNENSSMFNQIHEVSISYTFQKKNRTPKDSTFIPYNQLIVKNNKTDSISKQIDSTKVIITNNAEISDSSIIKESSKYHVVNVGEGIYIVKTATDSVTITVENTSFNEDSLVVNNLVNQIEDERHKNKINIVDEGNGVFTIKSKINHSDSIESPVEITDQMIDSLMNSDEFLRNITSNTGKPDNLEQINNFKYYTIQLLINSSNNYLLSNAEIVSETRVETKANGDIVYFYGYYTSKEEAFKVEENLKKYKDLKTLILPVIPN